MKFCFASLVALAALFSGGPVDGLKCRSGLNTSVVGIPLRSWEESSNCSSISQQSCFLGEISYETSFLDGELSLTYGSCISTAYESSLECESLFFGPDGLDLNRFLAVMPGLEGLFTKAIEDFAKDAANTVVEYMKNENGQLDNVKVVESIITPILQSVNQTMPENVQLVVTKFDTLILTAILNRSQVEKGFGDFLVSFNDLNTPDAAASVLLYGVFERNNISVPDRFKPMVDNVPGFIEQYVKDELYYAAVNTTLYSILLGLDTNDPKATSMAMVSVLKEWVPEKYNLHKFLDSFPDLIEQLLNKNFEYINTWNMNVLILYSKVTPATEAVSNSMFNLLKQLGQLEFVEKQSELKNLIIYYPGYFYSVLPDQLHDDLDMVLMNISQILDSFNPTAGIDHGDVLSGFSLNTSDSRVADAIALLNNLFGAAFTGNWTEFGIEALRALNNSATRTEESMALSEAILNLLRIYKVRLTRGFEDIIYGVPALFITAFPEHRDSINMIYSNISGNLIAYNFTNPDYSAIVKNSLSPLTTISGIPADVKAFLEELGPSINVADPVGSLQKSVQLLEKIAPTEMNETMVMMNTLPELLRQLLANNLTYLNTWNTEVIMAFSKKTPATIRFSDSVLKMTERFGLSEHITSDIRSIITHQPGFVYQMYEYTEEDPTELNYAYGNMSVIIDSIDRSKTVDLAGLLSLVPNFQSFPGSDQLVKALEGFIGIALTGDVNQIGKYALEALKNSSTLTTESSGLSDSIVNLLERMNVSVPDEWKEVINYYPGLFIEAYREQAAFIDTIYANFSQGLDNVGMTEESLVNGVESLISQLAMLNITFTEKAKELLRAFPSKFNLSDPASTLKAVLEILRETIPAEYSSVVMPLLETLPEMLSQLTAGNLGYINTWLIELLRLHSSTTVATEALKDAVLGVVERLGFGRFLDRNVQTWIEYQPGLFYQYFPLQREQIDNVLLNVSQILIKVDPTNPDFKSLLELMGVDTAGFSSVIEALESFVKVVSTGNGTLILEAAANMVMNLTTDTTEGKRLGTVIIQMLNTTGIALPGEVENAIRNLPNVFVTFFPTASDMIKMIYNKTAEGIENSLTTTYGISESVKELVTQLQTAGIEIPREVLTLTDSIEELIKAVISNDNAALDKWFVTVIPLVTPSSTISSSTFSDALKHLISQLPLPPFKTIDTLIDYIPRFLYSVFPNSTATIDNVYSSIAKGLLNINVTHFDVASVKNALADLMVLIPAQLHPLINGMDHLIEGIIEKNQTTLSQWGLDMQSTYCESNSVTTEFADSMNDYLKQFGLKLPQNIKPAFECVPGILYKFLPNQTEILHEVFGQIILMSTNYTAFVEQQFKRINLTLTKDLVALLKRWPDIQMALVTGNMTAELASSLQKQAAIKTELSELVTTILTKVGVNITEDVQLLIRQSTSAVYNPQLAAYFPTFDTIFSSLNADIEADKDIGVAIIDAFAKAKVNISDRYLPVLNNLQPLLDAAIKQDPNAVNSAVLDVLIAYNASFPSDQIQYQIYQMKLQLSLQNLNDFTTIPSEAFQYLGEMYRLLLKMANVTPNELKEMLLKTFPDGTPFIEIFFQIDPKDAFTAIANFTTWIIDPHRNASTLASHIQSTINILLTRHSINLATILKILVEPKSCKYETCGTDSCNSDDLLENVKSVTPVPPTTPPTTATTTTTSTNATAVIKKDETTATTQQPNTVAVTTTSGHVVNSSTVNVNFLMFSILFSKWWL